MPQQIKIEKMATRRELISGLPTEIIEAIEFNIKEQLDKENRPFDKADHITLTEMLDTEIPVKHKGFALTGAFSFLGSKEGEAYWWNIYRKYF